MQNSDLTPEELAQRLQRWVIEAIERRWIHRPKDSLVLSLIVDSYVTDALKMLVEVLPQPVQEKVQRVIELRNLCELPPQERYFACYIDSKRYQVYEYPELRNITSRPVSGLFPALEEAEELANTLNIAQHRLDLVHGVWAKRPDEVEPPAELPERA